MQSVHIEIHCLSIVIGRPSVVASSELPDVHFKLHARSDESVTGDLPNLGSSILLDSGTWAHTTRIPRLGKT
jgi:hypothetical protein